MNGIKGIVINKQKEQLATDFVLQKYDNLLACKSLGDYNCYEITLIFVNNLGDKHFELNY